MAPIDDLEVIRELLAGEPPSPDVNEYVRGRLTAVIAVAESGPRTDGWNPRRRRRLVLRSLAGVAAGLAATAVALAAAGLPGAHRSGTGGPAIDAAYVVKRIDSALSAADPGDIAHMTVTTRGTTQPGGPVTTTTTEEWSRNGQWRSVTNSATGHPLYDQGITSSSVYALVNYQKRIWASQPEPARPARSAVVGHGCVPVFGLIPMPVPGVSLPDSIRTATVASALRAAMSCGTLTVVGHQRVAGIEAIKLSGPSDSPISVTIWVSPDTYLPLRVVAHPATGQSGLWQTADITWLPPTAQNLARLTVPIPPGFRQVPLSQLVHPVLIPIGQGPRP